MSVWPKCNHMFAFVRLNFIFLWYALKSPSFQNAVESVVRNCNLLLNRCFQSLHLLQISVREELVKVSQGLEGPPLNVLIRIELRPSLIDSES